MSPAGDQRRAEGEAAGGNGRLSGLWRALRYRNYRLFFIGQSISLIGTWLTRVATAWLVYRLTKSEWMLGLVGFAGQIPMFLLAPFAGVWVDRWNRHRILVWTQVLSMLQSFALAGLTLGHVIDVAQIIWLSVLQGLINAFDMPARQAFVVEMVENREDVPNAIALNSSMVNAARLLGPSVAGILIAAFGEGICFLLDGISYIAVVISLLLMQVAASAAGRRRAGALHELKEGLCYSFGFAPIRAILLLLALVSLLGMSYTVLMPVFATQVLHGDSKTLGWLMAMSGVGALTGALYLASRRTVLGLGRLIAIMAGVFGAALVVFAYSHWLWLSLAMMHVSGLAMITHFASGNTILQTIVEDDKRGRVMSLFGMAFMGMAPFGSLLAGAMAERIGPGWTVATTGLCCMAAAGVFATRLPRLRRSVHPIYQEKGIIPAVAEGLGAASLLQETETES